MSLFLNKLDHVRAEVHEYLDDFFRDLIRRIAVYEVLN